MRPTTISTIAAWSAQLLSALIVLGAAAGKLLGSPGWVRRFHNWGYPDRFYLVVGVLELLGAIALLVPRVAGAAAAGLFVVMLGALLTHLYYGEGLAMLRPLIVIALLVPVMWLRGLGSEGRRANHAD